MTQEILRLLAGYAQRHYSAHLAQLAPRLQQELRIDPDAFDGTRQEVPVSGGGSPGPGQVGGRRPKPEDPSAGLGRWYLNHKPHLVVGISVLIGLVVVLGSLPEGRPAKTTAKEKPVEAPATPTVKPATSSNAELVERHAPWGVPESDRTYPREAYLLGYGSKHKMAEWVAFKVGNGVFTGANPTKQDDPEIDDRYEIQSDAYAGSGFDQCSLIAPRLVWGSDHEGFRQTGYFSLKVPMTQGLCRSLMKKLDNQIQKEAEKNPVWVMKGPVYAEGGKARLDDVAVPSGYFCVITSRDREHHTRTEAYILPNSEDLVSKDLDQFAVTLQQVRKETGLNLKMPE